jgi:tetratricopeptide (TPR) repeat protein
MKKLILATLLFTVFLPQTRLLACLNGFDDLMHYEIKKSRARFPIPLGHPLNMEDGEVKSAYQYNEQGYRRGNYQGSIDYALFLIYDKKYEEAEAVLAKLAEKYAGKYAVAANYGTILEVNGKNEEALKWIKKAIAIDPQSHDGSEWIHIAILEAKIRGDQPVSGARMTGHDSGPDSIPHFNLTEKELKKLQQELFFQLNERVTFIPPKDPYIAALLFELGNITLSLDQKKSAKSIYQKAQKYGYAHPLLSARLAIASGTLAIPAPPDTVMVIPTETIPSPDTATMDSLVQQPAHQEETHEGGQTGSILLWLGIGAAITVFAGWLMTKLLRGMK